jgi:hypothetical protein
VIIESLSILATRCDRCRREGECVVLAVHESDRGQYVYAIRLDLAVRVCVECLRRVMPGEAAA